MKQTSQVKHLTNSPRFDNVSNRITEDKLRLMADVDHFFEIGITGEDFQEDLIPVDAESASIIRRSNNVLSSATYVRHMRAVQEKKEAEDIRKKINRKMRLGKAKERAEKVSSIATSTSTSVSLLSASRPIMIIIIITITIHFVRFGTFAINIVVGAVYYVGSVFVFITPFQNFVDRTCCS